MRCAADANRHERRCGHCVRELFQPNQLAVRDWLAAPLCNARRVLYYPKHVILVRGLKHLILLSNGSSRATIRSTSSS